MTHVLAQDQVIVQIESNVSLVVRINSDMTKKVVGLDLDQIRMLRAVFEDATGVDPATISAQHIGELATTYLPAFIRITEAGRAAIRSLPSTKESQHD